MQHFDKSHFRIADDVVLENNTIPLTWWTNTPNFGDLLSPYLVEQLTSKTVKLVDNKTGPSARFKFKKSFSYLAIGSIISRANAKSIVWGSGAFGTETARHLNKDATYLAVRGPLTRNLLRINGISCPEVYGDPALLMPSVFNPDVKKKYKIGVILRWSETDWHSAEADSNVKKINLGTSDIEGTLTDILSCEKIVSSSLHGVILADAYGIPSAWLSSTTPKGLEFKFYDYFISVDKIQKPQRFDFSANRLSVAELEKHLEFDSREIKFDLKKLLAACPLVKVA
jgi:pyruvyltransferase